jgi:DNA-directed RNA polymerase II subunit RPB2
MDKPKIIKKTLPKINIGKMPIMVKSAICVLTQKNISTQPLPAIVQWIAADILLSRVQKTVLGQERAAENKIYCFDGKPTTKWAWLAEIKSVPDFKCISPKQVEMMILKQEHRVWERYLYNDPRIKAYRVVCGVSRVRRGEGQRDLRVYIA